ncbi:MAG: PHP domain-containing protein [Ignavibacteriales bacterium]|nr:PHP domain-containing protein [Ignavibacteriales bacterium]
MARGEECMQPIADLHTHTICSDGTLTPEQLVAKAKASGITILSVTDHDTVEGLERATACGNVNGISVLSGIEMSVAWNHREIHLLGYCFNPNNAELQSCLEMFRVQRVQRAEKMVKKLNTMNIPLKFESVLEQAGNGVVCRPHIAEALVEKKFASSYSEVFQKYIADGGPAYEKKQEFPLEEAVKIISAAGGLSFLAHPANNFTEKELFNIIKTGIDGIEADHPSHSSSAQQYYRGITNEYYLLESGGSDFHGGLRCDEKNFGQCGISLQSVERMRQRLYQNK